MRLVCLLAAAMALCGSALAQDTLRDPNERDDVVQFQTITPVLLTEDVGACMDFWTALGLEAKMTVPGEGGIGFAALSQGSVEIMYQSFAMARAQDEDAIEGVARSVVYIEVADLGAVISALPEGTPIVVPERLTDYGAREIYVRDPAGNMIGFAQMMRSAD